MEVIGRWIWSRDGYYGNLRSPGHAGFLKNFLQPAGWGCAGDWRGLSPGAEILPISPFHPPCLYRFYEKIGPGYLKKRCAGSPPEENHRINFFCKHPAWKCTWAPYPSRPDGRNLWTGIHLCMIKKRLHGCIGRVMHTGSNDPGTVSCTAYTLHPRSSYNDRAGIVDYAFFCGAFGAGEPDNITRFGSESQVLEFFIIVLRIFFLVVLRGGNIPWSRFRCMRIKRVFAEKKEHSLYRERSCFLQKTLFIRMHRNRDQEYFPLAEHQKKSVKQW